MSSSEDPSTPKPATEFTRTWRYKLGLAMIVLGNAAILVGALISFAGVGASTVGALVIGGEIVSLASIVFLGKEGFSAIKSKAFAFVKGGYAASVGPTRHYIGIALLCTHVVGSYVVAVYLWDVFGASAADTPPPVVWGLDFAQQESLMLWVFLISEISFVISLYVLGADWWGRVRKVFVWQEPDVQPASA